MSFPFLKYKNSLKIDTHFLFLVEERRMAWRKPGTEDVGFVVIF